MSVALVIPEDWPLEPLVRWAALLAKARREDLVLLRSRRRAGQAVSKQLATLDELEGGDLREAIELLLSDELRWSADEQDNSARKEPAEGTDADGPVARRLSVWTLDHADVGAALLERLAEESSINTLVLPRRHDDRKDEAVQELTALVMREASCEVLQLRPASSGFPPQLDSILVAVAGGPNSGSALNLAALLAASGDAQVDAVFVEPNVDAMAESVGMRIAESLVQRSLRVHADRVRPLVVLDSDAARGIQRRSAEKCDLVVVGASHYGVIRSRFSGVSEKLMSDEKGPALLVVRAAIPLANRIGRSLVRGVQAFVPQLDREMRVKLVERVQSSSRWDFDFIALIGLSTMIATFGLIQDSVAVVIGAMLIAPLMNPLLGFGLSLVQGNGRLARNTFGTILRGFCLAIVIAAAVGLAHPGLRPTSEMSVRGAPGLIDLLVAFVSGVAAAYAMGRPNLLSALPGVAIAAALVPPVATAGLCLAIAQWSIAFGALQLFLTNIVAIVLGAACSLWLVGIRGAHDHGHFATWAPRAATGLLLLTFALLVYEEIPGAADRLEAAVEQRLAEEREKGRPPVELVSMSSKRTGGIWRVEIVLGSATPRTESLVRDLRSKIKEHLGVKYRLRLETRLVQTLASPPD